MGLPVTVNMIFKEVHFLECVFYENKACLSPFYDLAKQYPLHEKL